MTDTPSERLTLEDVLGIRYPSDPVFDNAGERLGFLWNDGGTTDVWVFERSTGACRRASDGSGGVTAFAWSATGVLAWCQRGSVVVEGTQVIEDRHATALAFAPDGSALAVPIGDAVVVWRDGHPPHEFPLGIELGIINPGPGVALRWSPDGASLALATREQGRRGLVVLDVVDGRCVWQWSSHGFVTAFTWLTSSKLHVTVDRPPLHRDHLLVDIPSGDSETLVAEAGPEVIGGAGAHACPVAPVAHPDGTRIAYTLYRDGWAHLHLLDVGTGRLRPVTDGPFDDVGGGRLDVPSWAPGGKSIVFCSSRGDLAQRQLWRHSLDDSSCFPVTSLPGTNWSPIHAPSGDALAFLHAGPDRSPDIWLIDSVGAEPRQVTFSMPDAWSGEVAVAPTHMRFESADGVSIHADIFTPRDFDPSRRYPAVVFAHGGTIDQMRFGWSPGLPYLGPYSWHQYLVDRQFVVLSVDYRGSGGYGLDYQMALWGRMGVVDVEDCVSAGRWLRDQPWIEPERVGIWGISYGGYLTLAVLTKAPGVFRAGIAVAGVWDWDAVRDQRAEADVCLSSTGAYRMVAEHDDVAAEIARFEASPKNFADGLTDHLLVLHGSGDRKVTVGQTDMLIEQCVSLGKHLEVMYYPGEQHVFVQRSTWRDAFRRMEGFFQRHLG